MTRRERSFRTTLWDRPAVVWFDYSPGRPGRMYLRNGDPGYPEDQAEVEINRIVVDGEEIAWDSVSESDLERIEQDIWDYLAEIGVDE